MARPRTVTDEQILETMRRSVLELGPSVSLEVVAERLGVTSPALLKRFGSRQKLMIAALRPPEEEAWPKPPPPDDRPLEAQLVDLFTTIWGIYADVIPCVMALRESGIEPKHWQPRHPGPQRGAAAMERWLTAARERGLVEVEDLETAGYTMLGALHMRTIAAHLAHQSMATRHHLKHLRGLAAFFSVALAPRSATKSRQSPPPPATALKARA
jgi:AcrR family transcriptional regulator